MASVEERVSIYKLTRCVASLQGTAIHVQSIVRQTTCDTCTAVCTVSVCNDMRIGRADQVAAVHAWSVSMWQPPSPPQMWSKFAQHDRACELCQLRHDQAPDFVRGAIGFFSQPVDASKYMVHRSQVRYASKSVLMSPYICVCIPVY